ncbi:alpha/beta hydrolase family protein [Coraliomargarita sp. W4R72]
MLEKKSRLTVCSLRQELSATEALSDTWEGFEGWSLKLDGHTLRVILPKELAADEPWFWRPEFFGAFANTDKALLDRGWALVFLDLPDHYGCPKAIQSFAKMYDFATETLGLSAKMAIVALSRAGLSAYHFASAYPDQVCAIYADNPVCDFRSWPGGVGVGPGSLDDWNKLHGVYEISADQAVVYNQQPLSKEILKPIVTAGIPVLHVCGDCDEVVPFEENTQLLRQQFKELGGCYQEIMVPGGKHHPHGLLDPTPIIEFIEHAFARRV